MLKSSLKNLSELRNKFSKAAGSKVKREISSFLGTDNELLERESKISCLKLYQKEKNY